MKLLLSILAVVCGLGSLALAQRQGPPLEVDDRAAENAREQAADGIDRAALNEQREVYEAERKVLREALKAEIEALGRRAKREDVNEVIAKFKRENAALIAAQREIAEALQEARQAAQEKLPEGVKEMKDLLEKSRAMRKASKAAFKKALTDAQTLEERRQLLDEHLTEQRNHHRQIRDTLKRLREDLRNRHIEDVRRPGE